MNRFVHAIAGRLSLREPQRKALEILDRVTELAAPKRGADVAAALAAIRAEYPNVTDFERDFPSLCFALATGVGKTRLMGAFISYLHLAHGINNFFVLAPNLTIYDKLIKDFTPNTPKYVFKGIAEFAVNAPAIITGDNYDQHDPRSGSLFGGVRINIFNISKINSEVRGGKSPRIKRLSEYIGESYFDYLAGLPDLVLLMDESHRYRASAGVRAINELKPILGLELTATPFVQSGTKATPFKNVVLDYPLARALADGFVKEPAVVTRKDFNPAGMSKAEIERLKLEDGVRLHELTKVELETYARETSQTFVKPFVLVIAETTAHAADLKALIASDAFFGGRYRDKVIQVDSSSTGGSEGDEVVDRLLKVERADEITEIVIHVNMLKEGWDVTNLYTIVPLRAANARQLVEQSIGRGLRLPYGKRTGVAAVDRLSIVAHDRFQEIVDDANKPDSPVLLQSLVLSADTLEQPLQITAAPSQVEAKLGIAPGAEKAVFTQPQEVEAAKVVMKAIEDLSAKPAQAPTLATLATPELKEFLVKEVSSQMTGAQLTLDGIGARVDVPKLVDKVVDVMIKGTIDIPKITVVPTGDVQSGFHSFHLDLSKLHLQPPSEQLWVQYLGDQKSVVLGLGDGGIREERLEHYVVRGLVGFDEIAYEQHAELLYDLAGQVVAHLRSYLGSDEDVQRVLAYHERHISEFVLPDAAALLGESRELRGEGESRLRAAAAHDVHVARGQTGARLPVSG
jgi:type III restriction enzyme